MRQVERDTRPLSSTLPVWAGPAERLRFLLGYATLAPSRHNAQPWAFEIEGDEVRIFGDFRRSLHAVDPRDRELTVGCGAALFNLRIAAAHFGYATSVEVVAGSRRDGMLARVRLEERRSTTPRIEELFRAIPHRRTNRLPLDSREPPPGLVAELAREAALEGGMLRPVGDNVRRAVAELVAEGDRLQWRNPRFRAELSAWTRSNATRRPDGMPGFAWGMSDAASWVQPFLVRLADAGSVEADRDRRRALATKALLVLETHADTPADWLLAGEALQRVLLRATASGLYASYFNSAIEEPELRVRLREALGEMGSPQVMFRLGYGLEVRPTPRRPVDAVLRRLLEAPAAPQPLATRPRT